MKVIPSMPAPLTLHVVYVPGTVRILRLAAFSLLRRSSADLCLVGNGLPEDEARLLSDFAARFPRARFLDLPTKRMLPHDTVLSWLVRRHGDEPFAFADSDVFATGDLDERLAADLAQVDAVSYGDPLWLAFRAAAARRLGLVDAGEERGGRLRTYFVAYRPRPLREAIAATGVDFSACVRPSQVPREVAATLPPIDPDRFPLDTGELLGLVLAARGARLEHADHPALIHLGSMSPKQADAKGGGPGAELTDAALFADGGGQRGIARGSDGWKRAKRRLRRVLRAHFTAVLEALDRGQQLPVVDLSDQALAARVVSLHGQLTAMRRELDAALA